MAEAQITTLNMTEAEEISVKAHLIRRNGVEVIRRFKLTEDYLTKYDSLKEKLHEVFKLQPKAVKLYWQDIENDYILITSDDELLEAKKECQEKGKFIQLYMKVTGPIQNPENIKNHNTERNKNKTERRHRMEKLQKQLSHGFVLNNEGPYATGGRHMRRGFIGMGRGFRRAHHLHHGRNCQNMENLQALIEDIPSSNKRQNKAPTESNATLLHMDDKHRQNNKTNICDEIHDCTREDLPMEIRNLDLNNVSNEEIMNPMKIMHAKHSHCHAFRMRRGILLRRRMHGKCMRIAQSAP